MPLAAQRARPPIIDMHLHAHVLADYGGGMPVCTNVGPIEFPGLDPRAPITVARELAKVIGVRVAGPAGGERRGRDDGVARDARALRHPRGDDRDARPRHRMARRRPDAHRPRDLPRRGRHVLAEELDIPVDETIALPFSHPQVDVDIAQNDWGFPRAHFYAQRRRLIDAGFGKRIMWGSDQMIWPSTIGVAIETIERAPFLTAAQKRDIFYDDAARFLRLTPERIARDHGRVADRAPR